MKNQYTNSPLYPYQEEVWRNSRDREFFALWWEMGAGKSIASVATASWLYDQGEIDALVVIAPSSVTQNWTRIEVPKHMPEWTQTLSVCWDSRKASTKRAQKAFDELVGHPGLSVLAIGYDAVITDRGGRALKRILEKRRCLMILDEATRIKSPGSRRTKRILAASKLAPYRRILTGTPAPESALDVYAPIRFLSPDIWADQGIRNYQDFSYRFAVFHRISQANGRGFDKLVRYRNLDLLADIVKSVGSRVLKRDVLSHLPPQIFTRRMFSMDREQSRVYRELESEFIAMVGDDEEAMVSSPEAAVVGMKLRQIMSGFVKDDLGTVRTVGTGSRLALLKELLAEFDGPTIIWAEFSHEIDLLKDTLGDEAVVFDGRTSSEDRETAIRRFQEDGSAKYFVAKPSAAGEGLTLHRAEFMIFFSRGWSLGSRLQAEARAHRAGMPDRPVTYVDLIAQGTLDETMLDRLQQKQELADTITGDNE